MDFETWGVFLFVFLFAGAGVFLLVFVFGTSEQSFEDGLLTNGEKKEKRKSSGKKNEAESKSDAPSRKSRKKFGKKEMGAEPVEVQPEMQRVILSLI